MNTLNDNLGTFDEIISVLKLISSRNKSFPIRDIKQFCINTSLCNIYAMEGILQLLHLIGWIDLSNEKVKFHAKKMTQDQLNDYEPKLLIEKLIRDLLTQLKREKIFTNIFPVQSFDYDIIAGRIIIINNFIPLQFSGIKNLFISLGFFRPSPTSALYYEVAPSFEYLFESEVASWYEHNNNYVPDFGLTYDDFIMLKKQREELGEVAEKYILKFELERLRNHPLKDRIKQISRYKVNAGYDIVSFESDESTKLDRFIEVKSYAGTPHFYISKNEFEAAKRLGPKYYLYLVNHQIITTHKEPEIFPDAYHTLLSCKDWQKEVVNWYYSK